MEIKYVDFPYKRRVHLPISKKKSKKKNPNTKARKEKKETKRVALIQILGETMVFRNPYLSSDLIWRRRKENPISN